MKNSGKEKKPFKMINTFALLFFIICFVAILTYIIPAGTYDREVGASGRMEVVTGTYHRVEQTPASLFDVFLAIPEGISRNMLMVISVLITGGAIAVVDATGSINIGISKVVTKLGKTGGNIVLIFMFFAFSVLGGYFEFIEAALPFFPLAVAVSIGLGYDSLLGIAIALLGCMVGFAAGPAKVIPQALAGVPLYSGFGFRVVMWFAFTIVALQHILSYAKKIKKDPSYSYVADEDTSDLALDVDKYVVEKFTWRNTCILLTLAAGLITFIYMSITTDWYLVEYCAVFVMVGVVAGIFGKMNVNKIAETFAVGASELTAGALMIGVATGIQYVLEKGQIIDTIVHAVSIPLSAMPKFLSSICTLIFISILNFFIPSCSGKAAIIMPLLNPIADILELTRQSMVLIYQLGDGITNIIAPMGVIFVGLAFGRVPFDKWFKFTITLSGKLFILAIITIFIALQVGF